MSPWGQPGKRYTEAPLVGGPALVTPLLACALPCANCAGQGRFGSVLTVTRPSGTLSNAVCSLWVRPDDAPTGMPPAVHRWPPTWAGSDIASHVFALTILLKPVLIKACCALTHSLLPLHHHPLHRWPLIWVARTTLPPLRRPHGTSRCRWSSATRGTC